MKKEDLDLYFKLQKQIEEEGKPILREIFPDANFEYRIDVDIDGVWWEYYIGGGECDMHNIPLDYLYTDWRKKLADEQEQQRRKKEEEDKKKEAQKRADENRRKKEKEERDIEEYKRLKEKFEK